MKRIFSLLFFIAALVLPAFAQVNPTVPYPLNGYQSTYVDSTGHLVPYFLAFPNSGITTVIFDPSTSVLDITHCMSHLNRATSGASTNSSPLQYQVQQNFVSDIFNFSETRIAVPFSVNSSNSSTTLTTVPFTFTQTVATNAHYHFVINLYTNMGAGGSKIDVGGTCSTSNFTAQYMAYAGTSIVYGGQLLSFLSGPSGSNTPVTYIRIEGEMDVTNPGTFVVQFAQNSSNATNSSVIGGTFTLAQIP